MRISRGRKKEEPKKEYKFNMGITVPEVLVLDKAGANIGVMKTSAAMAMAQEQGLDLVEINPKSNPPVAKIIDFGQFRYAQEKEARLQKAHQHVVDIKGIRLSLRIGQHDSDIRHNQAIKFLNDGHKVKIEMMLRGREMQQVPLAFEVLRKFVAAINTAMPVRMEQNVEKAGNKVTTLIAKQ